MWFGLQKELLRLPRGRYFKISCTSGGLLWWHFHSLLAWRPSLTALFQVGKQAHSDHSSFFGIAFVRWKIAVTSMAPGPPLDGGECCWGHFPLQQCARIPDPDFLFLVLKWDFCPTPRTIFLFHPKYQSPPGVLRAVRCSFDAAYKVDSKGSPQAPGCRICLLSIIGRMEVRFFTRFARDRALVLVGTITKHRNDD